MILLMLVFMKGAFFKIIGDHKFFEHPVWCALLILHNPNSPLFVLLQESVLGFRGVGKMPEGLIKTKPDQISKLWGTKHWRVA